MIKLYDKFKDKNFVVLAIDIKESQKKVKKYVDSKDISFPVLLDTTGDVADNYGVRGTPAHLLIDKNGEVKAFATGYKDFKAKSSQRLIQHIIDNTI